MPLTLLLACDRYVAAVYVFARSLVAPARASTPRPRGLRQQQPIARDVLHTLDCPFGLERWVDGWGGDVHIWD